MFLLVLAGPAQGEGWSASPGAVTVGDSVRITASFSVVPGTSLRVGPLEPNGETVLLVAPEVTLGDEVARVSFTVAMFSPGARSFPTPALEMIGPSGAVRRVAPTSVAIEVRSVLPAAGADAELKPGFAPIPREVRRLEPLVFLELFVVFVAFIWWKMRSRPPVALALPAAPVTRPVAPLGAWAATGEGRAVAEATRRRLQSFLSTRSDRITEASTTAEVLEALASVADDLPYREIEGLFAGLDAAAFAPAHGAEVAHLASQVEDLVADLSRKESAADVGAVT
jgi:hypothetical protein